MTDTVRLTIDDVQLSVPSGVLVVDAARQAGIDIPTFCHHPQLKPSGACGLCVVEVKKRGQDGPFELQKACLTPVSEGLVVCTQTGPVLRARQQALAALLARHPLDCPVCDKGGECALQDYVFAYGEAVGRSAHSTDPRSQPAAIPWGDPDPNPQSANSANPRSQPAAIPWGDLVLNLERCIQCGRCARFLAEIADDPLPGGLLFTQPFDSHWSGNTADLCPVGALTPGDFYPGVRPWELVHHASVCNHCPVGCNITLQTRVEDSPVLGPGYSATARIKRVQPRQNELVNAGWICNKGRYGYHHSRAADRLTVPLVRAAGGLEPVSWDVALDLIAQRLRLVPPHRVAGVAGDRLSNEDLFLFQALMRDVIGTPQVNAYPDVYGAGLVARYGLGADSDWRQLGPGSVILVVAGDVAEQAPVWFLWLKAAAQRGAKLLVINGRPTKLDRYAAHRMRARYGSAPHLVLGLTKLLLDNHQRAEPPLPVKGLKKLQADLADFGPDTIERLAGVTGDDLQAAAEVLERAEDVIIVFGREGLNNYGALALVQAAANLLLAMGRVGRANNGLLPLWPHNNTQGAADMGVRHNAGPGYREIIEHGWNFDSMLSAMGNKSIKVLWLAGASLDAEPALDALDFLIVQDMFLSDTAHRADVVLPTLSFAERDGTYTSGDRRVQRFEQALPPLGQGRADWAILADVAARLGANWQFTSSADVLAAINARVPQYAAFTLQALRSTAASTRWPTAAERQKAELAFEWVELPTLQDADLVAVPVRWLYRQGTLIDHSPPLKERLRGAVAEFNPRDAARLDLRQGATVIATLGWRPIELTVYLDQRVPQGVVLVPVGLSTGLLTVSLWPVSER